MPEPNATTSAASGAAHVLSEAASAPGFKVAASGFGVASVGEWLLSSHGIAVIGLAITVAGFLLNVWSVARKTRLDAQAAALAARKDAREQAEHEARMRAMRAD